MDLAKVKHLQEGAKHCCYGTCNSDSRYRHRDAMKDVYFIPFPKPITQRDKCERWIKACGRPEADFNVKKIKRWTYICSKHFTGEKGPTLEHPDPIPAVLRRGEEQVKQFPRKRKPPIQRNSNVKCSKKDIIIAAESLIELSQKMMDNVTKNPVFADHQPSQATPQSSSQSSASPQ